MKINVATCQFPVDRDIRRNAGYVLRQMKAARDRGADVAHFCEVCLSGYAGVEFKSYENFDWELLESCTHEVLDLARRLGLWVILGSTHRLTGRHKPHNSLYIIDERGRIVERYDKMFCTGDRSGTTGDLARYSPGSHFSVFTIKGLRCGALICHDFRYPELYRHYGRRGVRLMFHSYHNGHMRARPFEKARAYIGEANRRINRADNIWGLIVPPTMQACAANNYMWISATNTSAKASAWASFFVRPDGAITARLQRNRAGIILSTVDTQAQYYDASEAWRDRALRGIYHSGRLVRDRRSDDRRCL